LRGVELLRALGGQPRRARLGVLADDLDRGVVVEIVADAQIALVVDVFLVLFLFDVVERGAGRAKPGKLGLLEVGLAPTGSGEDGFDELLVKRIDWHGGCTSLVVCLGFLGQARTGCGRDRSRVWSRRRWSDLRFSFINWLSRRSWSIDSRSAECADSARDADEIAALR